MSLRPVPVAPSHLGTLLVAILASLVGVGNGIADDVPRPDLDRVTAARAVEPPTRARWFFTPDDPDLDPRLESGAVPIDVVGRLDRFGGRWILEAAAEDVSSVESDWGARGTLRRDATGTPALVNTTRLIGARGSLWDDLEYLGDPGSTIAILDSGVDTAHDDLGDPIDDDRDTPPLAGDAADWSDAGTQFAGDLRLRVMGWHDVTDDLPEALGPWDYHYHGTAVASAGFGGGRRDETGRGVAPRGRLAIVKTWNFEDRWEVWASDMLLGIDWILENVARLRVRGVLIAATWEEDFDFAPAIEALTEAGILVIAAAGNDPDAAMGYPARLEDVFTVGAADFEGGLATYSTVSPIDGASGGVDLIAPGGSQIDASQRVKVADNEPQDGYAFRFGTSIAAAHVAGAVNIVSEVLASTARPWRRDAGQARAVADLLRITAARVDASEDPSSPAPRADGLRRDRAAGQGLLQVRAMADALSDVAWPGDDRAFLLEAPSTGDAVRAVRVPVRPGRPLRIELSMPEVLDADLFVHREKDDGYGLIAFGQRIGGGASEAVNVVSPREGWIVVVVRRSAGVGTATLRIRDVDPILDGWPLRMSAMQRTSPVSADVDGDGALDVVAVNNLALRDDVHAVFAVDATGQDISFYPEQYATPDRFGEFSEPAVFQTNGGVDIVSGSEFGNAIAVDADADVLWTLSLAASNEKVTAPVVVDPDSAPWFAFGRPAGIVGVDRAGGVVFDFAHEAAIEAPLAAGDLIGDAGDELVAVDVEGRVLAVDGNGDLLPGFPRDLGGVAQAPVLLGDGSGGRVATVGLVTLDESGVARLHRLSADGSDVGGAPVVLDTGGTVARAISPLVAGRIAREDAFPSWIVATIAGGGDEPIVARVHVIDATGAQTVLERLYADVEFNDASLRIYRDQLGEPRLVDLVGNGNREVLVPLIVGWADQRGAAELRFGVCDELVRFDLDGPARAFPRSYPRNRFPDQIPLAPLMIDLDGDGVPEWVVGRENALAVLGGNLRADLDGWTDVRGGAQRRACVDCFERVAVDAPSSVVSTDPWIDARPNPFNPRTRLEARLGRDVDVVWTVFDSRGRIVRRASSRTDDDGMSVWTFDGRDTRGRFLASGVYHVDARGQGASASTRVVLVR